MNRPKRPFITSLKNSNLVAGFKKVRGDMPESARKAADLSISSHIGGILRNIWDSKKLREGIRSVQDRANEYGYHVDALWRDQERSKSFRLLLQAVYALGCLNKTIRSRHRLADGRPLLKKALVNFSALLGPSCASAYYRDDRLKRVTRLDLGPLSSESGGKDWGFLFPEAMHGISWMHSLPREVLFDDGNGLFKGKYPCELPKAELRKTRFSNREGIVRCWAIQLRWDRARVALFLNWRAGDFPRIQDVYDPEDPPPDSDFRLDVRDIELATSYFNGWLARSNLILSSDAKLVPLRGWNILLGVGRAIARGDDFRDVLKTLILDSLQVGAGQHCSIHEVLHDVERDGKKLRVLKFEPGEYTDGGINRNFQNPEFDLALDANGLVKKSICAQAAAWETSLLIQNVQTNRRWRHAAVGRKDWRTRSEFAIPVKSDGRVWAVLNVEHGSESLTPEHLRRVELITHLYGHLRHARETFCKDREDQLLRRLLSEGDVPKDEDALLKRLNDWVRVETEADLVYILTYDHQARVFRPRGVSASLPLLTNYYVDQYDEQLLVSIMSKLRTDSSSRMNSQSDANLILSRATQLKRRFADNLDILSTLLQDTLAYQLRLLPNLRGRTWKVFTGLKPLPVPRVERARPSVSEFTAKYFGRGSLLALPFSSQVNAQPEGVIWIRWMSRPKANNVEEYLCEILPLQLQPALGSVACMYAVYNYYEYRSNP